MQTAGGVILPDAQGKKVNEGKVIAVGPGARSKSGEIVPPMCKVGDTVLLPEYGGSAIKLGDEEVHLFRDDDILGKFE